MARGILGGLFGGGDSSVMPGLLDQAGYMDPAEYDRRRQGNAMQGLWAGLLQGSGPSLEPRNFFSALGGGLAASQKSANEFDEAQLRRAQGVAAYQKSQLERDRLRLGYDVTQRYLRDQAPGAPPPPGAPPAAPGAAPDAGGGSGRGAWGPHADVAISTLKDAGYSPAAIQGIMANGLGEGGFDTPWRKAGGGENSFGHWQFNQGGELPGYLDFVRQQGGDPKDTRLQALYVAKRAEEVSPGFKTIDDPQKATDLFATKFERYSGAAPGQRYGLLTDAQRYMTGKPVEAVAPLAEVPRYGSNFERLPSEAAIPGLIAAGAPGPAPAPGATVIPDNALPTGSLPVPGHEYVRLPNGKVGMRPIGEPPTGDRLPTAVPPVTSTPGGTNGIDLRRGAALEQILSGQQTAMAGPPLRQLAQFVGPGAADSSAPVVPEAPVPGGITYGTGGMLGQLPPAAAAAAGTPAAAAPAPGGTMPGAAVAQPPALPAPPELPPIPAIAMPQPLPPPPAAAALRPLEATGAAPAVQLSPEQAARTRRAQGLALGLDLMGITVPKFIADEAGIDVAARSAAAQEAAKQPFAVQMKRLEADTIAAQKRWDATDADQKATLAAQRGLTVKQLDAQYANIHERFKAELDLFTAGPKAEAIAKGQLESEKEKLTAAANERIREAGPIAEAQKRAQLQQEAALQPQIEYNKALMTGVGKQDSELYQAAQAAHKSLYGLDDARQQLAAGIYTGKGADLSLTLAKWGSALGWPNEKIANTETYVVQRAQEVANILGSRAFGAGTGISDEDRRQAEKIAAGGTTLDLASIKKVLDTSEKLNKYIIERWNSRAPNEKLQITPPPSRSPPPDATYYGRTQSGSPVYTMPDGSRKVID